MAGLDHAVGFVQDGVEPRLTRPPARPQHGLEVAGPGSSFGLDRERVPREDDRLGQLLALDQRWFVVVFFIIHLARVYVTTTNASVSNSRIFDENETKQKRRFKIKLRQSNQAASIGVFQEKLSSQPSIQQASSCKYYWRCLQVVTLCHVVT